MDRVRRISNWIDQFVITNLKAYIQDISFFPMFVIGMSVIPDFVLSNIQTFLTDTMGFPLTSAAAIVNAYDGLGGIFGIVGAFIVHLYITHYGMICLSSAFYLLGILFLCLNRYGADITSSRWLVGVGLFLVAMGNHSLINSANALATAKRNWTLPPGNLLKYIITFILLVASISNGVPTLGQQQFYLPAFCMLLITLLSLCYLLNISFTNWNLLKVGAAIIKYLVEHTNANRFLENAEVKESPQPKLEPTETTESNKRCLLLRMVPMCMAFLAYGLVKSIGNTFFLDQANQMDTTIGHSSNEIPVQAFLILADLSNTAAKGLYNLLIAKKLKSSPGNKYSPALEYAMAMVLSALCCTVASWVAMEVFQRYKAISVFWLTPQFIIYGAMDGLASDGIEGFFSCQLPHSMRTYASVFTEGMIGVGAFFAISLVLVTKATTNWFNDKEPENNRLDEFYHLLTVVGISIFFGYTFVAVKYPYQDIEENQLDDQQGQQQAPAEETERPNEPVVSDAVVLVIPNTFEEKQGPNPNKESFLRSRSSRVVLQM